MVLLCEMREFESGRRRPRQSGVEDTVAHTHDIEARVKLLDWGACWIFCPPKRCDFVVETLSATCPLCTGQQRE